MMGADWWRFFSSSARSLEFSASRTEYTSTGRFSPVGPGGRPEAESTGKAADVARAAGEMGFLPVCPQPDLP